MRLALVGPANFTSLQDLDLAFFETAGSISAWNGAFGSGAFRDWANAKGLSALDSLVGPWDGSGPDTVIVAFSAGAAGVDELLKSPALWPRIRGVLLADGLFFNLPPSILQREATLAWMNFCSANNGHFFVATSSSNAGPNITTGSFALGELCSAVGAEAVDPPDWPLVAAPLVRRVAGRPVWGLDYQQTLGHSEKANHLAHINYCAARVLAGLGFGALKPNAPLYPPTKPAPNVPPKPAPAPGPPPKPSGTVFNWRTVGGAVEVQVNGEGPFERWEIDPPDAVRWERTAQWAPLVRQVLKENKIKLPLHWVMGVIYVESGGDPDAIGKSNGERGLMQVIPNGSKTDAFGFGNPEYGVLRGCNILAQYNHLDLPAAVSCYNAGPRPTTTPYQPRTSAASPWGYKEHPGHIEKVVRAANSFLRKLGGGAKGGRGSGLVALLGLGAVYLAVKSN